MADKKRFDACTPRPKWGKEGEVWWHRIGTAVTNEKGNVTVYLDSLPFPDKEGRVAVMLFEQRDREETTQRRGDSRTERRESAGRRQVDEDDEIPF